jgi:DNA-binding response OmpR family regulator
MVKLLLVEDEARLAQLIARGLQEEGHQVDTCDNGVDALEQALGIDYEVIILDWSLPERDGLSVLRQWRRQGLRTPVLMLTARTTVGEKVTGLRSGADDYLTKPFDFEELLARVEALHRRGSSYDTSSRFGPLVLDARRRVLTRGEREAALTPREFALCYEFFSHPREVLTRSELLNAVWGSNFDGEPNVVDVYVGYLRKKLAQIDAPMVAFQAVRGIGFRLELHDREGER